MSLFFWRYNLSSAALDDTQILMAGVGFLTTDHGGDKVVSVVLVFVFTALRGFDEVWPQRRISFLFI